MTPPSLWRNVPKRSVAIFLVAVFFVFASFGVANDVIGLGLQSPVQYAITIALSGLFAVGYASAGMILRGRSWKVFIPLFLVQFACMGLLSNALRSWLACNIGFCSMAWPSSHPSASATQALCLSR
jgi:hypothetical protein